METEESLGFDHDQPTSRFSEKWSYAKSTHILKITKHNTKTVIIKSAWYWNKKTQINRRENLRNTPIQKHARNIN